MAEFTTEQLMQLNKVIGASGTAGSTRNSQQTTGSQQGLSWSGGDTSRGISVNSPPAGYVKAIDDGPALASPMDLAAMAGGNQAGSKTARGDYNGIVMGNDKGPVPGIPAYPMTTPGRSLATPPNTAAMGMVSDKEAEEAKRRQMMMRGLTLSNSFLGRMGGMFGPLGPIGPQSYAGAVTPGVPNWGELDTPGSAARRAEAQQAQQFSFAPNDPVSILAAAIRGGQSYGANETMRTINSSSNSSAARTELGKAMGDQIRSSAKPSKTVTGSDNRFMPRSVQNSVRFQTGY